MKGLFICHPDFSKLKPLEVFHKEMEKPVGYSHPEELKNKHILFRKKAFLNVTGNAVLKITADDYFKLYINGKFVTQGPAPGYPSHYYYDEIDVTGYVKSGENTFAVHTYYQGLINRVWVSGDLRCGMQMSLDVDGKTVLESDETFRCCYHSGYTSCGKFGYDTAFAECYDSRAPEIDFFLPEFDDSYWVNAAVREYTDYSFVKQPTPQLEIYQMEPEKQVKDGNTVRLDFGRETVGYLNATVKGKSGDTVWLKFGEELNDDGSVRCEMRCNCNYTEKWLLSGQTDTLMQYDYKAFRYAEIILPKGAELISVSMTVRHYPFQKKAQYRVKSSELSDIIELCLDTVKYGTQEGYVDCPTREKGSYLGDISIAGRAQAIATGDFSLIKKAVKDFCFSSFVCPGLLSCSTCSLMQEIADYSLQFAGQVLWIYKSDGDMDFLKQTEPYVTGVYRYFLKYADESGLISGVTEKWNLVDWPDNLRDGYSFPLTKPIGKGKHNVINAFWYGFLRDIDEIYGILGKEKTGLTGKVKHSFYEKFYCHEENLFCDSAKDESDGRHFSVHSNILPLLFGMTDGKTEIQESIVNLIKNKKLSRMGVYMAYFALAALIKAGERELAEKMATDEGCWKLMLKEGATTAFEAWGKDQKWNCSLFHPWATAPVVVFAENALIY